jgi:hypothetical protein
MAKLLDRILGRKGPVEPPAPEHATQLRIQSQETKSAALRKDLLVREVNATISRLHP